MYGRKVKLRFFFVLSILLILAFSSFLILKSLEENVIYFQSPSEINSLSEIKYSSDSNSLPFIDIDNNLILLP